MCFALQTSALDTTTEVDLMRNINQTLLSKARTSIFIAHRCVFPLRSEFAIASGLIVFSACTA